MIEPTPIGVMELLARYDGVLLDVYGVLFDAVGLLPGAAEIITELDRRAMPFAIVTNDASRSTATYAARFAHHGIAIAADRFVTSGSLMPAYFRDHGLVGARTCILGTADSIEYVRAGGGIPIELAPGMELDALAVCDDDGFDFLPAIEAACSAVVRAVMAGRRPALVLPNPDLIYPKHDAEFGFTAGAIALLIEAALARRFPSRALRFVRLGKPEPHVFLAASRTLGIAPDRLVMIGDQIETDIAGARAAGVAGALLTGISNWHDACATATVAPDWLLDRLAP